MATFPIAVRATELTDSSVKKLYNSESNGYVKQRPQYTRGIKKFKIGFRSLTDSEKSTLNEFFENNNGLSFTFTNPKDSVSYECIFYGMDEIDFTYNPKMLRYSCTVTLREQ